MAGGKSGYRVCSGLAGILLLGLGQAVPVYAQWAPVARVEAGAVNPEDPLQVTLGIAVSAGLSIGFNALHVRALRQSRDRNSGRDLKDGRTFVLLEFERSGAASGTMLRQPFLRVGAGLVLRSPFKTTGALDVAIGLRYRLVQSIGIVGSLADVLTYLPTEDFQYCITDPDGFQQGCFPASIKDGLQHNVGLTVALEWRP